MNASEPASEGVASSVRSFLSENFLLGDGAVDDRASLLESGIVDSTGVMEIVAFLEETFGIEIAGEDLTSENLDSVERIVRYVNEKRSESAPPAELAS